MKILVQKFGGSSVATPDQRELVVGHIRRVKAEGWYPVVVVSAMGRHGDPYATDTLLDLVRGTGPAIRPRELDLLMSCGEIISCTVLAKVLRDQGYPALSLTGGQAGVVTDDKFGNARILEVRPDRILQMVEAGEIPVVAGFQGMTRDGEITTLGRGGSDTTAVALGAVIGAQAVEIYTDVDGVKTADPRLVPDAITLDRLTYQEVVEMAHLGARVIHPRAVEIAMEGRVPLRILSAREGGGGTEVSAGFPRARVDRIHGDRVVTGIAHVGGRAQVRVSIDGDFNRAGMALRVFQCLAQADISVDMIYVSPGFIACIISVHAAQQATEALQPLGLRLEVQTGFAKVSAVGAGMHGVPGVMARIMGALAAGDVAVYQTTDSHANISCLVREEFVEKAVRALHGEFGLGGESPVDQEENR